MSSWLYVHINKWKLWLSEKHNFRGCLNMMDIKKKGGGVTLVKCDNVDVIWCIDGAFLLKY